MPAEKNPLKAKRWPPIRPALRSFRTGRAVATPGVLETVPRTELFAALERHKRCDWGGVSEADWKANDRALKNAERLLSSYCAENGTKFWIITEGDRSYTTVLLPKEY